MSILDNVISTSPRAPRVTVYGKPGIGKTTFAASFPKPLFLLTEDPGVDNIQSLPVAQTLEEFTKNVKELLALESLPYETIVIDSASKLDALIVKYIQDKEEKKDLPFAACCGGYGKAYDRAQSIHRGVKRLLDNFTGRGITVVFVCHLTIQKVKHPDMEDYDVYSIIMNHDKSREPYIDDVDCVLFGRLKSFASETDSKRTIVKSTDQRIFVTGVNDVNVSKNRFNLPNEIPMDFEKFAEYIPFYQNQKTENKE